MEHKNGYKEESQNKQKLSSPYPQDTHIHSRKNSQERCSSRKSSQEITGKTKKESNTSLSSLNSQGSLGSRTTEGSFEDSPRKLAGRFHQAVRIRTGTKRLLNRWKSQSATNDQGSEDEDDKVDKSKSVDMKTISQESVEEGVKKSTWSEHVWSTFIHRGYSDDVTDKEPVIIGKDLLTDFQQDKFKYFFYHVLDLNTDHVISAEDFDKLNERIKHYMDWSVNTIQFLALKEVHAIFLDSFLRTAASLKCEQSKLGGQWDPFPEPSDPEEKCCVTIEEWLDVWGALVGEARKMNDLPMWLQFYPKTLFDTINRSGSGMISKTELQLFYTAFLDVGKLGGDKIKQVTEESFAAITSNGDVKLDFHIYKLSFLNFLLGKQPNGPGQYIFGMVTPQSGHKLFAVDYSALTVQQDTREKETFTVEKLTGTGDRKSIIV